MRRVTGRLAHGLCRRLRAASLLEAVVAAVLFLTAFAAAMELVPRLTVRGGIPRGAGFREIRHRTVALRRICRAVRMGQRRNPHRFLPGFRGHAGRHGHGAGRGQQEKDRT